MQSRSEIDHAIGRCRFHISADRFLLAAMEPPPGGDWRERLSLKRDLRRQEVLLNELRERKAEAAFAWKQDRPTARYVWRTQADEKVRMSHRANDGRVFSWSAPPPTGHPGEDYNCRCSAEPYVSGETEFASFTFTSPLVSGARRWGNIDFVRHYYFGRGRPVDLMEIGHLREIAQRYAYDVDGEGAFRRLSNQITSTARTNSYGAFSYDFWGSYDFGTVAFSHGGGRVFGEFHGRSGKRGGMLLINGEAWFRFEDTFTDPLDLEHFIKRPADLPLATPYPVTGSWTARFSAEVRIAAAGSLYVDPRIERGQKCIRS